jgi:hypothetical protein
MDIVVFVRSYCLAAGEGRIPADLARDGQLCGVAFMRGSRAGSGAAGFAVQGGVDAHLAGDCGLHGVTGISFDIFVIIESGRGAVQRGLHSNLTGDSKIDRGTLVMKMRVHKYSFSVFLCSLCCDYKLVTYWQLVNFCEKSFLPGFCFTRQGKEGVEQERRSKAIEMTSLVEINSQ